MIWILKNRAFCGNRQLLESDKRVWWGRERGIALMVGLSDIIMCVFSVRLMPGHGWHIPELSRLPVGLPAPCRRPLTGRAPVLRSALWVWCRHGVGAVQRAAVSTERTAGTPSIALVLLALCFLTQYIFRHFARYHTSSFCGPLESQTSVCADVPMRRCLIRWRFTS